VAGATNAVNASEALDNPDRIPVDVVVDEVIAVLEVLAFGDAIRGNEEVNFTLLREGGDFVAPLGAWREIREDLVKGSSAKGGTIVAAAADQRNMDPKVFVSPLYKRFVQIDGCVGKAVNTRTFLFGSPSLFVVSSATLAAMSFLSSCSFASVSRVTSLAALNRMRSWSLSFFKSLSQSFNRRCLS
jgi:hypothetical protein